MKGFVARKKYGPLLTSTGKLDKETASFIIEYARRWRYKSIFQVLIWSRAAKHMEMVYFFQQVHLYNVNLLGIIKHRDQGKVTLDKVKTDVNVDGFIGEVRPQIWRIPLSMKDLPFWDSSNLCSWYDGEPGSFVPASDTWDAPFRSNYYKPGTNSPLRAKASDMRRENVSRFIETPYCRDPSRTERFYANQPGIELDAVTPKKRAPPRPDEAGPSGFRSRPTPASYSPVKPSPRKLPAPQPPHSYVPVYNTSHNQFVKPNRYNDIVRSSPTKSSTTTAIDFRKNLKKPDGPDPIKELKEKGKTSGGSSDENENDEPPFNFQAMLRKTNYTRDSLKRSDSQNNNDATVVYQIKNKRAPQPTIRERNEDSYNNNKAAKDDKAKDMRSKFKRQSSIEAIKAMMIKQPSVDANKNPKESVKNGLSKEKVELAPGVMLYGDCAEL